MKTFFRNTASKRFFAVLLVLVVAASAVFAAPLSLKSALGDAKLYDGSYKAVTGSTDISTGYVLKTTEDGVSFADSSLIIEVEPSSLVQFINIDGAIEIYLLDGKAAVASTSAFTVRTPATVYAADASTEIYVISDADEETAYVSSGSAQVTNLISGAKSTLSAGNYIDNSQSNFTQTATTKADYWKAGETQATEGSSTLLWG